jgi:exodeoxyribonuclease VII large subunit
LPFGDDPVAPATESEPPASDGPHLYTVHELTLDIKARVEGLGRIGVEGEVSRITRAASGHLYFTLKDQDAVLSCSIWRSRIARALPFELEEGMHVVAHGKLDVYAPRGTYSLQIDRLEPRGLGALLVRLERLKVELRERGWFDREREIPEWPRPVGIVTSRDSAAFQDFLRTRSLRWPGYPVRLAHTSVQGPTAAAEIADAIRALDASGVDVIVLARGGGSLEDLWSFNELAVAEAVWNASVPVVTGIGHETDVTLVDHVADLRAHTPTDAAQQVIPDRADLEEHLERLGGYLMQGAGARLETAQEELQRLARARVLKSPEWMVADRHAALTRAARGLERSGRALVESAGARLERAAATLVSQRPTLRLERGATALSALQTRLAASARSRLERREHRLALAEAALEATSPLAVLKRGYSITRRVGETAALRSASDVKPGDRVVTVLDAGELEAVVDDVRPEPT